MATGTLNPNYVVGRYAYVVYDEGGLLDANAAGYPSTALDGSSITPVMMRHKISEACADLTQIGPEQLGYQQPRRLAQPDQ